ncbi:MAG TPA: flagellar export protein FliJ [Atribacteraceae bacterium]|nr:flagellar export protein FliJ [Atribacteraceae bacterium]
MRRYQFKLQKVLDTKKIREDLIVVRLVELKRLAESQEQFLHMISGNQERTLRELSVRRRNGENGLPEELMYEEYLLKLERRIQETRLILRQLEEQIRETRRALCEAATERKMVEKIREKDYGTFVLEMERNDRKNLDEIAIQAHVRR